MVVVTILLRLYTVQAGALSPGTYCTLDFLILILALLDSFADLPSQRLSSVFPTDSADDPVRD